METTIASKSTSTKIRKSTSRINSRSSKSRSESRSKSRSESRGKSRSESRSNRGSESRSKSRSESRSRRDASRRSESRTRSSKSRKSSRRKSTGSGKNSESTISTAGETLSSHETVSTEQNHANVDDDRSIGPQELIPSVSGDDYVSQCVVNASLGQLAVQIVAEHPELSNMIASALDQTKNVTNASPTTSTKLQADESPAPQDDNKSARKSRTSKTNSRRSNRSGRKPSSSKSQQRVESREGGIVVMDPSKFITSEGFAELDWLNDNDSSFLPSNSDRFSTASTNFSSSDLFTSSQQSMSSAGLMSSTEQLFDESFDLEDVSFQALEKNNKCSSSLLNTSSHSLDRQMSNKSRPGRKRNLKPSSSSKSLDAELSGCQKRALKRGNSSKSLSVESSSFSDRNCQLSKSSHELNRSGRGLRSALKRGNSSKSLNDDGANKSSHSRGGLRSNSKRDSSKKTLKQNAKSSDLDNNKGSSHSVRSRGPGLKSALKRANSSKSLVVGEDTGLSKSQHGTSRSRRLMRNALQRTDSFSSLVLEDLKGGDDDAGKMGLSKKSGHGENRSGRSKRGSFKRTNSANSLGLEDLMSDGDDHNAADKQTLNKSSHKRSQARISKNCGHRSFNNVPSKDPKTTIADLHRSAQSLNLDGLYDDDSDDDSEATEDLNLSYLEMSAMQTSQSQLLKDAHGWEDEKLSDGPAQAQKCLAATGGDMMRWTSPKMCRHPSALSSQVALPASVPDLLPQDEQPADIVTTEPLVDNSSSSLKGSKSKRGGGRTAIDGSSHGRSKRSGTRSALKEQRSPTPTIIRRNNSGGSLSSTTTPTEQSSMRRNNSGGSLASAVLEKQRWSTNGATTTATAQPLRRNNSGGTLSSAVRNRRGVACTASGDAIRGRLSLALLKQRQPSTMRSMRSITAQTTLEFSQVMAAENNIVANQHPPTLPKEPPATVVSESAPSVEIPPDLMTLEQALMFQQQEPQQHDHDDDTDKQLEEEEEEELRSRSRRDESLKLRSKRLQRTISATFGGGGGDNNKESKPSKSEYTRLVDGEDNSRSATLSFIPRSSSPCRLNVGFLTDS